MNPRVNTLFLTRKDGSVFELRVGNEVIRIATWAAKKTGEARATLVKIQATDAVTILRDDAQIRTPKLKGKE